MAAAFVSVTCPSCFESFEVQAPAMGEVPAEWDYDCEVCCRPMVIAFTEDDGEVVAEARGIDD
jgi:hypothetical protein